MGPPSATGLCCTACLSMRDCHSVLCSVAAAHHFPRVAPGDLASPSGALCPVQEAEEAAPSLAQHRPGLPGLRNRKAPSPKGILEPAFRSCLWKGFRISCHPPPFGEQGTWGSRTRKHREAGRGRPGDGGVWAAKTVTRPPPQPAQPQDAQTAHPAASSTAPSRQPRAP